MLLVMLRCKEVMLLLLMELLLLLLLLSHSCALELMHLGQGWEDNFIPLVFRNFQASEEEGQTRRLPSFIHITVAAQNGMREFIIRTLVGGTRNYALQRTGNF